MVKMTVKYQGDLRCELTHGPSGNVVLTDAPVDNNGKGEAFSPTDLVSAALGACMMTIMGIVAKRHDIDLKNARMDVVKEMVADPQRRIGAIHITCTLPKSIPVEKRSMFEQAALTCPVHKSLAPNVNTHFVFNYAD